MHFGVYECLIITLTMTDLLMLFIGIIVTIKLMFSEYRFCVGL